MCYMHSFFLEMNFFKVQLPGYQAALLSFSRFHQQYYSSWGISGRSNITFLKIQHELFSFLLLYYIGKRKLTSGIMALSSSNMWITLHTFLKVIPSYFHPLPTRSTPLCHCSTAGIKSTNAMNGLKTHFLRKVKERLYKYNKLLFCLIWICLHYFLPTG